MVIPAYMFNEGQIDLKKLKYRTESCRMNIWQNMYISRLKNIAILVPSHISEYVTNLYNTRIRQCIGGEAIHELSKHYISH
jgi:hypothetical protein